MISDTAPAAVPFSFEVYPPRTPAGMPALCETISHLAAAGPQFISVTFGAGGSTTQRSLGVLTQILQATQVPPLAHLTCVGTTYAEATATIRTFLDAGIRHFLALRGDPPAAAAPGESYLGDLESAAQLVQLIDRVQAERAPYQERAIPGVPGAIGLAPRERVEIGVAAFPQGHPRSRHRHEDIDALLAKQAAGATFALTQLFFDAEIYVDFTDRARRAGVHIPIIPGIMPVLSVSRLDRVQQLTGDARPERLAAALTAAADDAEARRIGTTAAATLVRELVAAGAPGIHLYAFNSHDTVLAVLDEAGVATHTVPQEVLS